MLYYYTEIFFTFFNILLYLHQRKGGRNEKEKTKSTRRIQGTVVT